MQNKLMFAWEPMAIEECISILQMIDDDGLVLTVIEDVIEGSISGYGRSRAHIYIGEQAGRCRWSLPCLVLAPSSGHRL